MASRIVSKVIKCGKTDCPNETTVYKSEPGKYGYCEDVSDFSCRTSSGYRCSSSSSTAYYFCSAECLKYFESHNRCNWCYEDGEGTYIPDLDITLCTGRGDCNPPCTAKYQLQKRLEDDYQNPDYVFTSKIVPDLDPQIRTILCSFPSGFDKVYKLIFENGQRVSSDILRDICSVGNEYELRERTSEKETVLDETRCMDCKKKLKETYYYVNDNESEIKIDGYVCCGITADERNGNGWHGYNRFACKGKGCYVFELKRIHQTTDEEDEEDDDDEDEIN